MCVIFLNCIMMGVQAGHSRPNTTACRRKCDCMSDAGRTEVYALASAGRLSRPQLLDLL